MKKLMIVAVLAAPLTSCRKEYTCRCYLDNGNPGLQYENWKGTKKNAKEFCNKMSNEYNAIGGKCTIEF